MTFLAAIPTNAPVGLRSRKHIHPFQLHRPVTIDAALADLKKYPRASLMAGGIDLIDRLKSGALVEDIIHISGIDELCTIHMDNGDLVIGATATHADIEQSQLVLDVAPYLAEFWNLIANPRIRHMGTIGGNLRSGQPHYDLAPALAALDALVKICPVEEPSKIVPVRELNQHDTILLHSIRIPQPTRKHLLFDRTLHPALAVYLCVERDGSLIKHLRLGIGGAYEQPVGLPLPISSAAPERLTNSECAELAKSISEHLPRPLSDGICSAGYRHRMIEVQVRRLLEKIGTITPT